MAESASHFSPSVVLFQALIRPSRISDWSALPTWFLMPVKGQISISSDRNVAQESHIERKKKKRVIPITSDVIDTTPDET